MKAYIVTNSDCTRRRLDASRLTEYFKANGWELTDSARSADVIVVVTCAYTQKAEDLAVEMVEGLSHTQAKVIVSGCLPSINPERLDEVFSGITLPTHSLHTIDEHFPESKVSFSELPDAHRIFKAPFLPPIRPSVLLRRLGRPVHALQMLFKKRSIDRARSEKFYIRTSWGCRGACSYCVIPSAIGKLRSKPVVECRNELAEGLRQGVTSFVLDGDDLGAYGLDIGLTFPDLLRGVLEEGEDYTLEIEELNPRWLVEYAEDLVSIVRSGRIRAICCCVQSGNSRVLKLMNRYHDVDKIVDALRRLREASPSLELSTHVIVGFPSETEEELEDTIGFLEKSGFSKALIFPYEDKAGSKASHLEEKVPREVIAGRAKRMHARLSGRGVNTVCV